MLTSLGSFPKQRYFRAVFSSIPDFADANDNVCSSFNNFISFLTWQSVTIHSPFNSGVWIIFRPPEKPGILIVVRREF